MGRPKHKVQSGFVLFDRLLRRRDANIEPQGAGHRTWWTGRRRPGAHFCRNAGPHDRRDVWHATWAHKDDSTVTKIVKLTDWFRFALCAVNVLDTAPWRAHGVGSAWVTLRRIRPFCDGALRD